MRQAKELKTEIQRAAAALGRIGRGASKRRNVDYSALARLAHEKRAENKSRQSRQDAG